MNSNRQRRFAQNVKGNDFRGIGGSAFKQKGYKFPSHEQMDKFQEHKLPYDIDIKLRELIIILNDLGYRTGGSCSGHSKDVVKNDRGFITILPSNTDRFLYDLKQNDPDKFASAMNAIKYYGGFSRKPIDPDKIKLAIKKYLKVSRVVYKPPNPYNKRSMVLYHAFTFPSVSYGWG